MIVFSYITFVLNAADILLLVFEILYKMKFIVCKFCFVCVLCCVKFSELKTVSHIKISVAELLPLSI